VSWGSCQKNSCEREGGWISRLTIVDRLVPVDVDRTKLEPEVVPDVTKFTHFIFADGATRTPSNDAEVQLCERSFGPDRRGMATTRSKNSSRSDERRESTNASSCCDKWGFDDDDNDILMSDCQICSDGRIKQKYILDLRRCESASTTIDL